MRNSILIVITAVILTFITSSCSKDDSIQQKEYKRVSISKLTILKYPATKTDGSNWDNSLAGTFPDIYFDITIAGTTTSLYKLSTSSRAENLRNIDLPYSWANSSGSPFFVLPDLNQLIDIDLYDYESVSSDELISTTTVDFLNYTTGSSKYPPTVTITNGSTSIKLDLIWLE